MVWLLAERGRLQILVSIPWGLGRLSRSVVRLGRKAAVTQKEIEAWIRTEGIEVRVYAGEGHVVGVCVLLIGLFKRSKGLVLPA